MRGSLQGELRIFLRKSGHKPTKIDTHENKPSFIHENAG